MKANPMSDGNGRHGVVLLHKSVSILGRKGTHSSPDVGGRVNISSWKDWQSIRKAIDWSTAPDRNSSQDIYLSKDSSPEVSPFSVTYWGLSIGEKWQKGLRSDPGRPVTSHWGAQRVSTLKAGRAQRWPPWDGNQGGLLGEGGP